jgi:hypothetical protein
MYGDKKISKFGHYIGAEAIDMFSIKILNGDKEPLNDPYSIVLTDQTATALFGTENPMGKMIKLDNSTNLKVTAIVPAPPKPAH